ncbi:hypothetical protein FHX81_0803 [Saccharothrix saharensis]|uniref:Uncharacterized protein n=1 Tax=Saccharothrix saharensis TaxID=571190 RepID=A0A543J6T2_9PSEU|nr:hypothetical protein [Saccharothrix saharensis]TQM78533.1 hypothetical protein FHX81_0803 [Saccharothrix saharensis]
MTPSCASFTSGLPRTLLRGFAPGESIVVAGWSTLDLDPPFPHADRLRAARLLTDEGLTAAFRPTARTPASRASSPRPTPRPTRNCST